MENLEKILADQVDWVRSSCSDNTTDGRAAIERRGRTVQDLKLLNETGIDEISGRIRKVANIKLVAQRYAIDQHRDPIPSDSPDADAFSTKSGTGRFSVNARRVAKNVGD